MAGGGRITGSHVYARVHCAHAATLDMHEDRARRRAPAPWEEMVLRRGREHEERVVAELDVAEPQYGRGDYDAGARATVGLMREGAEWVFQGVLVHDDGERGVRMLGLPDLLRRVPGGSALGDWHYEVVDVKSSARPRGDQILQVAFYSRLLAEVQGRAPVEGAVVLKDGREERFRLGDYGAALAEVVDELVAAAGDRRATRPFYGRHCGGCRWSEVCLPELEERDDLSLLQGMTPGLRTILEGQGVARCADLLAAGGVERLARRSHLESAQVRRLLRAAEARAAGRVVRERRRRGVAEDEGVLVHFLTDPFAERVLWMGVRRGDGRVASACPGSRGEEGAAFEALLAEVPGTVPLLHYGAAVPRWYAGLGRGARADLGIERRLVDLARQLRGAAVYPAPVFGLEDHVRHGLGVDPFRAGPAAAAALWAEEDGDGGRARLEAKGRADLGDLARLREELLAGGDGGA